MADGSDIPAWIALFMGLYALGASIGELRSPGFWLSMLDDYGAASGLRFLTGIVLIALGAAIYLSSPWRPDDWLSVLVTIMGGGMAVEGFVVLAFGEPFFRLARGLFGIFSGRGWAVFSAIMGVALIGVSLARI